MLNNCLNCIFKLSKTNSYIQPINAQVIAASARAVMTSSESRFDASVTSHFEFDEVYRGQSDLAEARVLPLEGGVAQNIVLYNSLTYERIGQLKFFASIIILFKLVIY